MTHSLVLFDCDGTLFLGDDECRRHSMLDALSILTDTSVPSELFEELDHEAQPARWVAREAARRLGIEVDLDRWVECAQQLYFARFEPERLEGWAVPEGAHEALDCLQHEGLGLSMVTDVPEKIARLRLTVLDLERYFPNGQGAYGCEADDRDELLRLALARAGKPPDRVVQVGDTSRDARSARRLGIEPLPVAFGGNRKKVNGAVRTMPELVEALVG